MTGCVNLQEPLHRGTRQTLPAAKQLKQTLVKGLCPGEGRGWGLSTVVLHGLFHFTSCLYPRVQQEASTWLRVVYCRLISILSMKKEGIRWFPRTLLPWASLLWSFYWGTWFGRHSKSIPFSRIWRPQVQTAAGRTTRGSDPHRVICRKSKGWPFHMCSTVPGSPMRDQEVGLPGSAWSQFSSVSFYFYG